MKCEKIDKKQNKKTSKYLDDKTYFNYIASTFCSEKEDQQEFKVHRLVGHNEEAKLEEDPLRG